jgi:hypothetical protein
MLKPLKYYSEKWNMSTEIKKIVDLYSDVEVERYDADAYLDFAIKRFKHNCDTLSTPIIKNLKEEKKNKKSKNIVCFGLDDYSWMGTYFSLKSSSDRAGHFNSLKNIVSDALFEYHIYVKQPTETLKFYIATDDEAADLFGISKEKIGNIMSINTKCSFFEKLKKGSG